MSRKVSIALAAAATLAVASLSSSSSHARSFGGPLRHGSRTALARVSNGGIRPIFPVRPRPPGHPPIWVFHPHHHWVFRGGRWIIEDIAVERPVDVAPVASSPCTCLTKTYTPTGLVVFADICTKESASAPATEDNADASQAPTTNVPATVTPLSQVPTAPNYAGRTYQDYLAANPLAAQPQADAQSPQQPPLARQQD